jgi:hypothetical protein
MRLSVILSSLAGSLLFSSSGTAVAPVTDKVLQPVIVELFTSEGCSSCPPADALLMKLDRTQPIPGVLVIPLSEHVDYWDHLGWKDPFSSPVFSRRQEAYGRRFHLNDVYTPQAVIDGTSEALGSDPRQIEGAVRRAAKADKLDVRISAVLKNGSGVPVVHVDVLSTGKPVDKGDMQLKIALAESGVVSHVRSGENSGRTLDHVAVVRSLVDIGRLDAAGAFSADVPLTGDLKDWGGKRIVAFVQSRQSDRIRGAAFRALSSAATN